ncbi:MAG TPA: holo-ACP synthase [Chloroflexota bacterium]|nr:holo-ACP synthase [Chloroflexota bacterium]
MRAVGVDIIEIGRVRGSLQRFGDRFLDRVYTAAEQAYCCGRAPQLAGRFAAKEAVSKALGTGIRRIHWRNIEILPNRAGAPRVTLHGPAQQRFESLGLTSMEVSISHSRDNAVAVAIAS